MLLTGMISIAGTQNTTSTSSFATNGFSSSTEQLPRWVFYSFSSFLHDNLFLPFFSAIFPHFYLSLAAATPGSSFPSRNSEDASPPVEIWCHLVSISELVYCCRRDLPANDCNSVCLCQCLCHYLCAICEFRHLKTSHWSIPYDCLCCLYCLCIQLLSQVLYPAPSSRLEFHSALQLCICVIRKIIRDH